MRRLRVLPRKLGEQGGDARMRITDDRTGSAAHDLGACMLPDRDHAAFLVFWGATWDLHGRPNAASLGGHLARGWRRHAAAGEFHGSCSVRRHLHV